MASLSHRVPSLLASSLLSFITLLVSACDATELSVPPNHPGNPNGRVGKLVIPSALRSEPKEQSAPAPAPSAARAYTCPMHPEIVKPAPGKCPICGMDLVPKKESK